MRSLLVCTTDFGLQWKLIMILWICNTNIKSNNYFSMDTKYLHAPAYNQ